MNEAKLVAPKTYYSRNYLARLLKTKTTGEIAKENNVSYSTIWRSMHKFNLTRPLPDRWSLTEIKLLKNNYPTVKNVYKLFPNRTKYSLYHKAHKLKLARKYKFLSRKYNIDDRFFDKWNENSAYVFGFLCSDGCVSSNYRTISFHLSKKDIKILKLIKKVIKSDHPIKIYENSVELKLNNVILAHRVNKLGCTPKKSLILQFPNIPKLYLNHFVRGYFDGDGSISFNRPNTIRISLIGTKEFLKELQNKLYIGLGLQKHKLKIHKKMKVLVYYGNDARVFCSWIYNNCGQLFLQRKYERYINHLRLRFLNGRN